MSQDKDRLREQLSDQENELLAKIRHTEQSVPDSDPRWLSIARTHLELAFMSWKRAIYQGKRVGD